MAGNLLKDTEWGKDSRKIHAQYPACRDGASAQTTPGSGVWRSGLLRLYFLTETLQNKWKILQTNQEGGAAVVEADPGSRALLIFLRPSDLEELLGALGGVHNTEQDPWEECGAWRFFLFVEGKTNGSPSARKTQCTNTAASPTQLFH